MATYRSYRDLRSREFIKTLKIDAEGDRVNCDLAFKLPRPAGKIHVRHTPLCVGVGVMAYSGWKKGGGDAGVIYDRYIGKMCDFVAWLVGAGMQVRLLMGGSDDRRAIEDLIARLKDQLPPVAFRRIAAEQMDSLHALMEEIARTDIVVATRYHNIVCALNMERPAISLGYAEKNDELMARVGLAEFCQSVETFSTSILKAHFRAIVRKRFLVEEEIGEALEFFRAMLDEQEALLERALDAGIARTADMLQPIEAGGGEA